MAVRFDLSETFVGGPSEREHLLQYVKGVFRVKDARSNWHAPRKRKTHESICHAFVRQRWLIVSGSAVGDEAFLLGWPALLFILR